MTKGLNLDIKNTEDVLTETTLNHIIGDSEDSVFTICCSLTKNIHLKEYVVSNYTKSKHVSLAFVKVLCMNYEAGS